MQASMKLILGNGAMMSRRKFLQNGLLAGLGAGLSGSMLAAIEQNRLDAAAKILEVATAQGTVAAAALYVAQKNQEFLRSFGQATSNHAMFLLGSITKPICVTALMTFYDRGEFRLDDSLTKFIPEFKGEGREKITIRMLLSHCSGLPDQLPENNDLRRQHAGLPIFVEHAIRAKLGFEPGAKYQYSSMGILLACRVAEILSGLVIHDVVAKTVFEPLKMSHSALGLGRFPFETMVACQTERAAPESGGGDPSARNWDWNSLYWRKLGAPWGGAHCSAADVGSYLREFLERQGRVVRPETAALMVQNQNPVGLASRGLGLNVGAGSPGCSPETFGHTGSTGTLAWADPRTATICVVLTSLPGGAVKPHPREDCAAQIADGA